MRYIQRGFFMGQHIALEVNYYFFIAEKSSVMEK